MERMVTRWGPDPDGTWHRLTVMSQWTDQPGIALHTTCGRMLASLSAQPEDQPPGDERVCPDCETGVIAD